MKDAAIQQIRVGAMLVIVLYHCVCYYGIWGWLFPNALNFENINYWKELCNVALTAFVFISGLLYARLYLTKEKYRNQKNLMKDKMHRLFYPYIIWVTLAMLLFPSEHILRDIFCGAQHLWFLLMLMSIFLIVIVMGDKLFKLPISIGCFTFFTLLNIAIAKYGEDWINFLAWKTAIRFLPAFLCGILTVRLQISERMMHWPKLLQILTFVASSLLVVFVCYMPSLPFGRLYVNIPIYCFLICLYALLSARQIRVGKRIIDNLDKNSMGIYIIHHLLIWGALIYIPGLTILMDYHYILSPFTLFLITLTLSWLMTAVLNKNSYTKFLFNTKNWSSQSVKK